jgi:hypothetical protein
MRMKGLVLSVMLAVGLLSYGAIDVSAQMKPKGLKPGVISATALNKAGTYCHLTFPAIDPATLSSKTPKLLAASSGDIIDYYGACDHDPVGFEEVCRQRVQRSSERYCDE